ncbi:hypothetical protein N7445_008865 [Penicillium cf. griseofulvum]|nr:hypothetical protein N7445_008865 [Penicillium cf. griseofulvum]
MSQYPPTRPWAAPSSIDREYESGILHEHERQQWLRENPHVVPQAAKKIGKKSLRPFADRGPSMAEGLRGIAERGAARRNGTTVNKNDVSTKPLPPIPQETSQPATTVGQEGVFQGSDSDLNKMSIRYVLNGSDMQGHRAKTLFTQREASQSATEVCQNLSVDGSVYSSGNMNPKLKESNLRGYDDETPLPREYDAALAPIVPISDDHNNAQAICNNHSSVHHGMALAALSCVPLPETSSAQANSCPHHHGHSPTSWYEASPTGSQFTPDSSVAVAPGATLVREIKQEYQVTAVDNPAIRVPEVNQENEFTAVQRPTIKELIALINRDKENCRPANEIPSPGSSSSAYRLAPPNSASTNIYHVDQLSGSDYQDPDFVIRNSESPQFAIPRTIPEVTPTTPMWSPSPSLTPPPCFKGCCASDMPQEPLVLAPSSPLFVPLQEASACNSDNSNKVGSSVSVLLGHQILQEFAEVPVLPSSSPVFVPLQGVSAWDSDNSDEDGSRVTVTFGDQVCWDDTTPDSPLLYSPPSPALSPPSHTRRPSDLHEYCYADVPRVGISPSRNIPHDPRLTTPTFRQDYMSSLTSYPRWLSPAHMDNVDQSLVPPQLNVTKKNPNFTTNVPIHDVSQYQTAVHASEPTNGVHSYAASFVSNESSVNTPSSNATLSRASRSPDISSSEGSEDSGGTKRKRFTKNLFGKKGYLEDNEGPRDKKFKFIKGALQKGHSTIGSIKGIFLDENRAMINSSKPSIVTENTAPITLNTDVQSILYAEIENMITHAANEFLMKEYYDGHLTISSLNRVKKRWEKKNMPGVPQFRFDQHTQYKLISANRDHLNFGKASNGLPPYIVLRSWKRICKSMSIRTFVAPDSVIKKHIHDTLDLLEILKADECHIELIMALDAHVRGELKKHDVMQHCRDTQNSANSRS